MGGVLGLAVGFLVWSSGFALLYGLHAVGCAHGWQAGGGFASPLRLALLGLWALHLAVLAWLLARYRAAGGGFIRDTAVVLTTLALLAMLWTGAPVAVLRLCV